MLKEHPRLSDTPFILFSIRGAFLNETALSLGDQLCWKRDTSPVNGDGEHNMGTVGGILKRQNNGRHYALTAWHCIATANDLDPHHFSSTAKEEGDEAATNEVHLHARGLPYEEPVEVVSDLEKFFGPDFAQLQANFDRQFAESRGKEFYVEDLASFNEYKSIGKLADGVYSGLADVAAIKLTADTFDCTNPQFRRCKSEDYVSKLAKGKIFIHSPERGRLQAEFKSSIRIKGTTARLFFFEPVSEPGDSGGLWYCSLDGESTATPLGLHRGKSPTGRYSVANRIDDVLGELQKKGLTLEFCDESCTGESSIESSSEESSTESNNTSVQDKGKGKVSYSDDDYDSENDEQGQSEEKKYTPSVHYTFEEGEDSGGEEEESEKDDSDDDRTSTALHLRSSNEMMNWALQNRALRGS